MRGLFTAGVIDIFPKNGLDEIIEFTVELLYNEYVVFHGITMIIACKKQLSL